MLEATKVPDCDRSNDSVPQASKTPPESSSLNYLDLVSHIFKDVGSQSHFSTSKHKGITEEALLPEGLSEGARFAVEVGNLAQDLDASTRAMPPHHFDDNMLGAGLNSVEDSGRKIAAMLAKPDLSEDDEVKILQEFGQKLHIIQDFYAHSNYVEANLKANPSQAPYQIPLMNFSDIKDGKAGQFHSGFYYYKNTLQNESSEFLGRASIISHLNQLNLKIPGTSYLPTQDYQKLNTFEDRLNYFTDPRYSVLHYDLNKDNEKSDEGKVVDSKTGKTLHEYARNLAIRETQRQWSDFEDEVHRVRGRADGDKILNQMKNISFSNSALRSLRYSVDGIITWMS